MASRELRGCEHLIGRAEVGGATSRDQEERLGGWKTLSMVERYAHVAPEGLQVAAIRLENALRVLRSTQRETGHESLFINEKSGGN